MAISVEAAAQALREAMREELKRHSLWYLVQGVLMALAGAMALLFPLLSSLAVTFVLGWLLLLSGVFQGISLIGARSVPHFWIQLLSVILGIVVGLLLLNRPGEGLLTMTLLLIVFFMMEGFAKIVFALTIRPFPNWGWILASGLAGVVMAGILWNAMPVTASWLLGLLLGVNLLGQGSALGYLAWRVRST